MNPHRRNRPAPRRALISGASQGLGRAFAEECAARGMDLFLVPGCVNKLLRVVGPYVPRALVAGVTRHLWGEFTAETRDAVAARS